MCGTLITRQITDNMLWKRPIKPIYRQTREVLILHNFGDRLAIGMALAHMGAKT